FRPIAVAYPLHPAQRHRPLPTKLVLAALACPGKDIFETPPVDSQIPHGSSRSKREPPWSRTWDLRARLPADSEPRRLARPRASAPTMGSGPELLAQAGQAGVP